MKHPNIVETIGACMKQDVCPCLITEFIEGERLSDYLQSKIVKEGENIQLNIDDAKRIQIIKGIASGLQFLHNCSPPIIHRDLTPNNIFVGFQFFILL